MLIVSVHAGAYGMWIYAIMLPSGVFSVAHCVFVISELDLKGWCSIHRGDGLNPFSIINAHAMAGQFSLVQCRHWSEKYNSRNENIFNLCVCATS